MIRLNASAPDFAAAFAALVDDRRESDAGVSDRVAAIIRRVRAEGDAALHALAHSDEARVFGREAVDLRLVGDFRVEAALAVERMPYEIRPHCPRQQEQDDRDENGAETSADDHGAYGCPLRLIIA